MMTSMPMNVWANPEPGMDTKGALKFVAIAFESIVLPVPGAPSRSRPRSRFPPAASKASPDCQSVTTLRTSSFASAWPRTSSSFTPQSASPGSYERICEMPMNTMRAEHDEEVAEEEEREDDQVDPHPGGDQEPERLRNGQERRRSTIGRRAPP